MHHEGWLGVGGLTYGRIVVEEDYETGIFTVYLCNHAFGELTRPKLCSIDGDFGCSRFGFKTEGFGECCVCRNDLFGTLLEIGELLNKVENYRDVLGYSRTNVHFCLHAGTVQAGKTTGRDHPMRNLEDKNSRLKTSRDLFNSLAVRYSHIQFRLCYRIHTQKRDLHIPV